MTAVSYVRVSSEEQAERGTSIAAQRKALRRWAKAESVQLLEEFADEGISAYAPAAKRPGFGAMISYCKKNPVDLILVHKLDRFSRDREESIVFKGLLKRNGVTVRSIMETYDPETPAGFLYEGMIETINQFYSMNLAQEVLKGMKENAERGFLNGGALPYGYRRAPVNDGGRQRWTLTPGPSEEVRIIREMFRMAVEEGKGVRLIAQALNAQGIPSPRGGTWSTSTVNGILGNPAYCGDLVWRRRKTKDRTQRQTTEEGDRTIVRDAHPPLVSREVWEKRQALSASRPFRKRAAKTKPSPWLLGRMITCSLCGGSYVGRKQPRKLSDGTTKHHSYYVCHTRHTKRTCEAPILRSDWLEGEVIALLRSVLGSQEALQSLESQIRERLEERRRSLSKGNSAAAELRRIEAKIDRYWRAIGEGLDASKAKDMIRSAEAERDRLQEEAAEAADAGAQEEALTRALKRAQTIGEVFGKLWETMEHPKQRQAILAALEGIKVGTSSVNILFKGIVGGMKLDISGGVVNLRGGGEPFSNFVKLLKNICIPTDKPGTVRFGSVPRG